MGILLSRIRLVPEIWDEIRLARITCLDGPLGYKLRYRFWKKKLKYLGENVLIDTNVFISNPEYISIGSHTHIDKNCILVGSSPDLDLSNRYLKTRTNRHYIGKKGQITIGDDCHLSQNTMVYGYGGVSIGNNCVLSADSKIYSLTSMAYNPEDRSQVVSIVPYTGKSPTLEGPVVLEDNVWAGIGCIISPGVTIEKNSFIKSLTIINTSFPENSYIGGSPAVRIRERYSNQ